MRGSGGKASRVEDGITCWLCHDPIRGKQYGQPWFDRSLALLHLFSRYGLLQYSRICRVRPSLLPLAFLVVACRVQWGAEWIDACPVGRLSPRIDPLAF